MVEISDDMLIIGKLTGRRMNAIQLFLSAVLGRIAAEICGAKKYFLVGKDQLPRRYRQPSFYFVCVLEALVAGCAAFLLASNSNLTAFTIGVMMPKLLATPTSIAKLAKFVKARSTQL